MAKPRRRDAVMPPGTERRSRAALLASTVLQAGMLVALALPAAAQPAPNAQPSGATLVGGAATISQTATTTTISQSSQRAALNWKSFNVGSQQTVTFQQPSSSSIALNQVVGPNPSQIAGRIDANGQVVLVNQSGVVFYQGAQVNVAGLMVSAPGITAQQFMAGTMKFDQPANPNALVQNQGTITVRQAGLAALVAPQVANSGVINAKLGNVVLAGANATTLDLYGDGLMSFAVTKAVTQVPLGQGRAVQALVTNTGTILADGGTIVLTARAADGILQTLVHDGGKIRAASVGGKDGTVVLNAVGGSIVIDGEVAATGVAAGTTGGAVVANATGNVTVASGAVLNASGQAGGGVIALGTTLKRARGGPSVPTTRVARNVTVQPGATIAANATGAGAGGRVTVLSSNATQVGSPISAKGGPKGGAGGFVEVSGGSVGATVAIDVTAPHGTPGTILLDPEFLNIVAGGSGSGSEDSNFQSNNGTIFASDGHAAIPDTISNGVIDSWGGNVLLQAEDTITVAANVNLKNGSLTLSAGGPIMINGVTFDVVGDITVNSGVNLTASGDVVLRTAGSSLVSVAHPLISVLGSITSTGGSVSLLAGADGIVNVGAAGAVTSASGQRITIQTDTLTVASGAALTAPSGTVEIAPFTTGLAATLAGTGGLAIAQTALGAVNAATLDIGAVTLGGVLTTTAGAIAIGGTATMPASTPTLLLNTSGAVTEASGAVLTVGTLAGDTGPVNLNTGLPNVVAVVGSYTASGGDFVLSVVGGVTLAGPIVANGVTVTGIGASQITVTGAVTATGTNEDGFIAPGTVSLSGSGVTIDSGGNVQGDTILLSGANGITLNGDGSVGATSSFVDLSTTSGDVIEASTATLDALRLTGSAGVTGNVSLLGSNAVLAVGDFTVTADGAGSGNFAMRDTSALRVVADITTGSGNVFLEDSNAAGITLEPGRIVTESSGLASFQTDVLALGKGGEVITGTFELAPDAFNGLMQPGTGGAPANLNNIASTTVRLGAVTEPGTAIASTRAGTITVVGTFDALGRTLELDSNGAITGTAAPLTDVGTLVVSGAAVNLTNASNSVTDLGNATATRFALQDSIGLTVVGTTTASLSAAITSTGFLTVDGAVDSPAITLTSGAIAIAGSVSSDSTGTVGLFATAGAIDETGTLIAGTLSGSASGAANLTGATPTTNQVAALGNFSAAGFTLDTGGNLVVSGAVAGGAGATILDAGALTVSGSLGATAVSLTGNDITLSGGATVAGTTVALTAATGALGLVGTLDAPSMATLSAASDISGAGGQVIGDGALSAVSTAGSVDLSNPANAVASVGGTALGSFALADSAALAVGTVTAGTTATLTAPLLTATGTVTAPTIALTATTGTLGLGGTLNASTAATLSAQSDVSGPGEVIGGGALTAVSTTGSVDLGNPANTVASVGGSAFGSFTLVDGVTLGVGTVSAGGTATFTAPALTVAGTLTAPTVALTASSGALGLSGTVNASNAAVLSAQADIAGGGPIIGDGAVTAISATGSVDLTNPANAVASANGSAFSSFALVDSVTLGSGTITAGSSVALTAPALTVTGAVTAPTVLLTASTGNLTVSGSVAAAETLGLFATAGGIGETGALVTGTLTGDAAGSVSLTGAANSFATLGSFAAGGDLALRDGRALTVAGAVSAGGVAAPNPANTATLSLTTGGALGIGVAGGAAGSLNGGTLALTAAGPISEPNGTVGANTLSARTTGNGGDIVLASAANQIAASSGIAALAGQVVLVDDPSLQLTGAYSGSNLFFEVNAAGGSLALGGAAPASLTVPSGGRITLVADAMTATAASSIIAPQGTLELAPFSAIAEAVAGASTGGLAVGTTLLGDIAGGSSGLDLLRIGGFTEVVEGVAAGGTALVVSASAVALDGPVSLTGTAGSLQLLANGPVTQPSGTLSVADVFGATSGAGGDFALSAAGNAIGESTGISAANGRVVVVDGASLTLVNAFTGNTLFFEVAAAGGTLSLGAGPSLSAAALTTAAGGRASLVADAINDASASPVTTAGGTIELSPFSGVAASLFGSAGWTVSAGLLGNLSASTLTVGGFTPAGAANATVRASSLALDAATNLTGIASTLQLLASGAISQPGGALTVGTLTGSGGSVSLTNPANAIGRFGALSATAGNLALADSLAVSVAGAVSAAGNVYLATPNPGGISLTATGSLGAGATDLVGLQAATLAIAAGGAISGGTFEFAPGVSGETVLLGPGGSLVSLAGVTTGFVRIGAVTLPGGAAPTTFAGAIATTGTFDATGLPLELDATGAVAGTAGPLVNVATLSGTGGAWTLTAANGIAVLGDITASSFALTDTPALSVAGTLAAGTAATIADAGALTVAGAVDAAAISLTGSAIAIAGVVNDGGAGTTSLTAAAGAIGETGTVIAGTLSGSATATASFARGGNRIAALGTFTAAGFTLDDGRALSVDGTLAGGPAVSLTASNLTIPGAISDGGAGTTTLVATAGTIAETGSLVAGTLSGSAAGAVSLTGSSTVATLGNFTATGFTLDDARALAVNGTLAGGPAVSLTATDLTIPGTVSDGGAGTTTLVATAGTIGETGALVSGALSGSAAGTATFGGANNAVAALGDFTSAGFALNDTGNLRVTGTLAGGASASIVDAGTITVAGSVGATAVGLTGSALTIPGSVSGGAAGTVNLAATAGTIDLTGTLVAGTLTGSATGAASLTGGANSFATLGSFAAGGDLALRDGRALTVAGAVSAGGVAAPNPANGATLSLTTGGALGIGVAGGAAGSLNGGTVALSAAGPISEPNGTVGANTLSARTTGNGGDIVLASAANQIAASSGIAALAGQVVLVDDPSLQLTGAYSGSNLFFEVNAAGGSLAIGGAAPASLTVPSGGRITLVADAMTATAASSITAPQGTLELAPFSAIAEAVAGASTGGLAVGTTLLGDIASGSSGLDLLRIGGFTEVVEGVAAGGTALVVSASAVALDGPVSLTGTAASLELLANGPVTQPSGTLSVADVFGATSGAGGDFALSAAGNAIGESTGISAANGNVVVVDGASLTLLNAFTGNTLFFEVAAAGGTLSLGAGASLAAAALTTAAGGRASLVADAINDASASPVTTAGGTIELSPFSGVAASLFGSAGWTVSAGLLGNLSASTLTVGGFTPAGAANATVRASSLALDAATNLTGIASTLQLLASGAISQPGGALTVGTLTGSGGSVSLTNPANAIGTFGALSATAGNVALADSLAVSVAGAVSATGNVYLATPNPDGISLAATGSLGAGAAGMVGLQAATLAIATGGAVSGGTFEFAPGVSGATVLLGPGGSLVSLAGVTTGFVRIGAVTLPGGAAPTTFAGAIATTGTFDATGLPLELDATGAIAGTAGPLVNVATLSGTGAAWTLTAANGIAVLGDITASSFALTDTPALRVAGTLAAGTAATIADAGALTVAGAVDAAAISLTGSAIAIAGVVNDGGAGTTSLTATAGAIGETGTVIAGTLSGSATATASFARGGNRIAALGNFTAAGLTLDDGANLLIGGTVTAPDILVQAAGSQITLGNGAAIVTGGTGRAAGPIVPADEPSNGGPGALFQSASFAQVGSSTVTGAAGGPATLQVSVTGNIGFDPPAGLAATGAWLILNLTNGAATGSVFVKALDVSYTTPGSANLFGTINGVAGPNAALAGNITPAVSPDYLFNGCKIGAVTCTLPPPPPPPPKVAVPHLPGEPVPLPNLALVPMFDILRDIIRQALVTPSDKDDLLQLPVVSERDY